MSFANTYAHGNAASSRCGVVSFAPAPLPSVTTLLLSSIDLGLLPLGGMIKRVM